MGRQSQQRIGNQHKRKHKLAGNNSTKRRKGGQATLLGGVAFEAERDCIVCRARDSRNIVQGARIPNRAHHVLCIKNTKTKGNGNLNNSQLLTFEENKRYKALTQPITAAEKGSARHLPKDGGAAYFKIPMPDTATTAKETMPEEMLTPMDLCQAVTRLTADTAFAEKHKAKGAPLAMMAFAEEVAAQIS